MNSSEGMPYKPTRERIHAGVDTKLKRMHVPAQRISSHANARVEMPLSAPMSLTLDQILEEARQWPEDVVTELVDRLMVAKHGGLDSSVDLAWRTEAQRRLAELESGQVQGVPLEETLARARAILGR
jgi:hypothetical protein